MKSYQQLILSNKAWVQEITEQDPQFFKRQVGGQRPEILWIGCSDSRVSPDQITQTLPGEMFIHRNIANLVHADDLNFMSVLQYAIEVLEVQHIVLCGHYGCGGIRAVLEGRVQGPIAEWLENANGVRTRHAHEIESQPSEDAKVNRFVECNVRDQLLDVARTDIVQAAFAKGKALQLHGWVYDVSDGLIKPLLEIDAATDLDVLSRPQSALAAEMPEGL